MIKNRLSILFVSLLSLSFISGCKPKKVNVSSNRDYSSDVITSNDNSEFSNMAKLTILATNDVHGNVIDSSSGLGIAKTSTMIKSLAKDRNKILLSQGDMWQGTMESNYTKGNLVTEWMNYMDFTAMTLGNHEFDWGQDVIRQNKEIANFPFLGINVLNNSDNQRVSYADASVVKEIAGVKVGIIGAIGNCYSSISSSLVTDIHFAVDEELTTLVKNESNRLRKEEGCNLIIYSAHGSLERDDKGKDSYDISLSKEHYVDLVLEGHTHQQYIYQDAGDVYHIQGNANNGSLNRIDIDYDLANNNYSIDKVTSYRTADYSNLKDDEGALDILEKYKDQYEWGNEPLGYNASYRNSTFLRNLVAELYRDKGMEKWESKYNIVLGGGYISVRTPYNLYEGTVTYSTLNSLFPFNNEIVLCSISGNKLDSQFVNTSNENYYISLTSYGNNVVNNINPSETYYIITDTYCSDYAPNALTVIDTYMPNIYARDLLADYIKNGGLNN